MLKNILLLSMMASSAVRVIPNFIPLPLTTTRTDLCPHGTHYIDSCVNSCACDPRYGGAMCSRMIGCDELKGTCPFGEKYSDPLWGVNFECQCNHDKSQTYECYDLNQQQKLIRYHHSL